MKKVLFPGSFDPITKGHINIIKRLINLGFYVEIGILNNRSKNNMFSPQTRMKMIQEVIKTKKLEKIEVFFAEGMLVDICKERNINIVARGLRSVKDYEYEKEMEINNKMLNDNLEYIYINTDEKFMSVSSTVVRELIYYNANIKHLVPNEVISIIKKEENNEN